MELKILGGTSHLVSYELGFSKKEHFRLIVACVNTLALFFSLSKKFSLTLYFENKLLSIASFASPDKLFQVRGVWWPRAGISFSFIYLFTFFPFKIFLLKNK